jgi:hypothetical protein
MDARYIFNSDLKTQGTNMDQQSPSDHATSKARETAKLWAKFPAHQATMGSFKGHNKIEDQETFQSTGMPDCNHCNESQASSSR